MKIDYKLLLKIPQKTLGRSDLYIDYTLRSSKEKRKPLINIDFLSDFGPTADSLDLRENLELPQVDLCLLHKLVSL